METTTSRGGLAIQTTYPIQLASLLVADSAIIGLGLLGLAERVRQAAKELVVAAEPVSASLLRHLSASIALKQELLSVIPPVKSSETSKNFSDHEGLLCSATIEWE